MVPRFKQLAVPQHLDEPRQIRLFRRTSYATGWFGCPIEFQQDRQVPAAPKRGSYNGELALKAMIPTVHKFETAHQQVDEQPHPDLPAYGVGAVAYEVGELERLLDLLEEHFDIPTAAVEFGDRPRAPFEVVGDEGDLDILAVDFNECDNPAQFARIGFLRRIKLHLNDLVAQDALVPGGFEGARHFVLHVVLRPANPPDVALRQFKEMLELVVRLVEHGDFAGLEVSAQAWGHRAVVVLRRIDDGAAGQEALQVEAQVELGRSLATAVLRPVHAVGDQLDRGRVQRMDRLTEAPKVSAPNLALREARNRICQMLHHAPVKLFGHVRIAHLVRMAQGVARGRNRPADSRERCCIHLKRVAHIIKPKRMGEVGVQQRNHMAPRRERPAPGIDAMLLRKVRHHVSRNQIAQLFQDCIPMSGWFVFLSLFFHTLRVEDLELTS